MGSKDMQLNSEGDLDILLKFQYRAYSKKYPPLNRVKPVPVQVIYHIASITASSAYEEMKSISDMIQLAYFFLLKPRETPLTYVASHRATQVVRHKPQLIMLSTSNIL